MNISPNDIVPESYQMRLMAWRDEFTRGYFEIGDIANEIVALNVQKGMKIDQERIHAAIGKFCGKSGRTIRDYSEIASFYPVSIREEYDVLSFAHFRFAKSCGLHYRDVLEYSAQNPGLSTDALEYYTQSHILSMSAGLSPSEIKQTFEDGSDDGVSAPESKNKLSDVYALSDLIQRSERLLSWTGMNAELHQELMVALESLKHVLACLSAGQFGINSSIDMRFDYTNHEVPSMNLVGFQK
jgi:hypothetical protein